MTIVTIVVLIIVATSVGVRVGFKLGYASAEIDERLARFLREHPDDE